MSVSTPERRQSLAYTKTVNIPVNKNAHQVQFPATPFLRTKSVTRFGVSVEKVVATMLMPKSHQGIFLPAKKNDFVSWPACLEAQTPTRSENIK